MRVSAHLLKHLHDTTVTVNIKRKERGKRVTIFPFTDERESIPCYPSSCPVPQVLTLLVTYLTYWHRRGNWYVGIIGQ